MPVEVQSLEHLVASFEIDEPEKSLTAAECIDMYVYIHMYIYIICIYMYVTVVECSHCKMGNQKMILKMSRCEGKF